MATIAKTSPSRLAKVASSSRSWDEARAKARSLYRLWHRSAPEICALYAVSIPPSAIRAKVRQNFEQYRGINDLETMDVLLHKGYVEYQEAVNCWKMESHVFRWFAKEEAPPKPETFMEQFYNSRDEERVRPSS